MCFPPYVYRLCNRGFNLIISSLLVLKGSSKRSIRTVQVLPLPILAMRASRIGKSNASLLRRNPHCLVSFSLSYLQAHTYIRTQASDTIKRTRLDITATLLSLPPLQLLPSNDSEAPINYDMMWLGTPVGMFVVCRGVHHGDSSKRPVTHSFLLRRKEAYEEDARADGVWPLVAVAHQMMVFDGA